MNGAFYALIIPQPGPGVPTHPIAPGGSPPYPSQGPGFPTHPIAPGGQPPGIWGGAPPYIDAGFPGPQPGPGAPTHPIYNPPYPSQGPGFPTNPIAPGGQPPGIWGGGNVPWPTPPIYYPPPLSPGMPSHPIYNPPGIWGGGNQPFPTNPIVIPPGDIPEGPVGDDEMVIVIYVPGIGYKMAVVPKPPAAPGYNPPTGPSTERPTPVQGQT